MNKNLNLDIKDWCHQIKKDALVIFEPFSNTILRSEDKKDSEGYTEDDEDEDGPFMKMSSLAVYQSPYGMIKMPEFCDITKHFKLWTMYVTNPITDKLRDHINKTLGIETFEIFTPYRARIGICPLYKDHEVLNKIKTAIENLNPSEKEKT